jgi:uncharacterized protein
MTVLSQRELDQLASAETEAFASPIPTQVVASDEYYPIAQTETQKRVEARMKELGDKNARRNGMSRRQFFQTAAGMATAFAAMNDVFGPLYNVGKAEAASVEAAAQQAQAMSGQFIIDVHTHFLRPGTRIQTFVNQRKAVGQAGWNPQLVGKDQTINDLMYANWFKEVYMDSDTKVALISGSPSDIPEDWFLTNEMKFEAREKVNKEAGSKRLLSHAIFTPGQPGWLERVDREIEQLKPDSWKGYTVGDNTNKNIGKYPWRLDDEKVMYPFYEKILKAGNNIVCVHKGLFPPSAEQQWPHLTAYSDVRDVGKAAKDWPQISFVIYHSAYRFAGGGKAEDAWAQFEKTGRVEWVTDLAEIPEKFGVSNVYGDLGQIFAQTNVVDPKLAAALLGTLIRGLGHDHVIWGTDAIWTGSPQWQIESMRRLEIPEDMQKKYGFKPLGAADGPVKTAIFGDNSKKMYNYDPKKAGIENDRFVTIKEAYLRNGASPSNLRYGYVLKG